MDRRAFVAGAAAAMSTLYVGAAGSLAAPTRTISAYAEDRLLEMLALIPDSDRFRGLLSSEMRWVDVAKQIDAFGGQSRVGDGGSVRNQGYWPDDPDFLFATQFPDALLHLDQALSIGHQDQLESLSIFAGVDSEAVANELRDRGYKEVNFGVATVLSHAEIDIRRNILVNNRFVAVLTSHDAVVFASNEEDIIEYAGLMASDGPTLAAGNLGHVFRMLRFDSWSQMWRPGRVLHKLNFEFSPNMDVQTVEMVRDLEHLEQQRFGVAPEALKVAIGVDAGLPTKNLRDPEATPIPVIEGYDEEPSQYIFLQYESEDAAQRACEIIEWRWENSISWVTGAPLPDSIAPEPIDQSQIKAGLILQTFAYPFGTSFLGSMIDLSDPSIYGWGAL